LPGEDLPRWLDGGLGGTRQFGIGGGGDGEARLDAIGAIDEAVFKVRCGVDSGSRLDAWGGVDNRSRFDAIGRGDCGSGGAWDALHGLAQKLDQLEVKRRDDHRNGRTDCHAMPLANGAVVR